MAENDCDNWNYYTGTNLMCVELVDGMENVRTSYKT